MYIYVTNINYHAAISRWHYYSYYLPKMRGGMAWLAVRGRRGAGGVRAQVSGAVRTRARRRFPGTRRPRPARDRIAAVA